MSYALTTLDTCSRALPLLPDSNGYKVTNEHCSDAPGCGNFTPLTRHVDCSPSSLWYDDAPQIKSDAQLANEEAKAVGAALDTHTVLSKAPIAATAKEEGSLDDRREVVIGKEEDDDLKIAIERLKEHVAASARLQEDFEDAMERLKRQVHNASMIDISARTSQAKTASKRAWQAIKERSGSADSETHGANVNNVDDVELELTLERQERYFKHAMIRDAISLAIQTGTEGMMAYELNPDESELSAIA